MQVRADNRRIDRGSKAVSASSRTAAANASGGARQGSAAVPGALLRAETPPAQYWRRWCADAPPPQLPVEDAPAANEPLPQVLPQGDGADAPYRVLIVEDDPSQALFAETVLNGTGMQARVVGVSS